MRAADAQHFLVRLLGRYDPGQRNQRGRLFRRTVVGRHFLHPSGGLEALPGQFLVAQRGQHLAAGLERHQHQRMQTGIDRERILARRPVKETAAPVEVLAPSASTLLIRILSNWLR